MNSNEQTQAAQAAKNAATQTEEIGAGIKTDLSNLRGAIEQGNAIPADVETYLAGIEANASQLTTVSEGLHALGDVIKPDDQAPTQPADVQPADVDAPERPTGAKIEATAQAPEATKTDDTPTPPPTQNSPEAWELEQPATDK